MDPRCWEADAEKPGEDWTVRWRERHQGRVVCITGGGGDSILTAGLDGRIVARNSETGEQLFAIPNHKAWLGSMRLSEEKDLLVTDGRDNAVLLYDFSNPEWSGRFVPKKAHDMCALLTVLLFRV